MNQLDIYIKKVNERLFRDYLQGDIFCGENGPYDDKETKVRNLCALIISSCISVLDGEEEICEVNHILNMVNELYSFEDVDGLYIIRNKDGKDFCNGVLGHAWVMEALMYVYLVTKDKKHVDKCTHIFESHKFNEKTGLWMCPIKFGGKCDMTINHQIWFAGVAAELYLLTNSQEVMNKLQIFADMFWKNTSVHMCGLICHYVQGSKGITKIKSNIKVFLDEARALMGLSSMRYKENGYHMFCLTGLARIKMAGIGESIFTNRHFSKALRYCNTKKYRTCLLDNKHDKDISTLTDKKKMQAISCNIYGYSYNAPGFEVEYVHSIFSCINETTITELKCKQLELTYNPDSVLFENNTMDKFDLSYKVYEGMIKETHWKER